MINFFKKKGKKTMLPASNNMIKEITHDYKAFLKLGNSVYKAAYYAITGRGFTEMQGKNDLIIATRPCDSMFVIMVMYDEKLRNDKQGTIRKVIFGTDNKVIIKKMKGGEPHEILV